MQSPKPPPSPQDPSPHHRHTRARTFVAPTPPPPSHPRHHLRHTRACRGYLDEYSADVRATLGEIAAAERGNDGGGARICPERAPSARARLIRRPRLDLGPIPNPVRSARVRSGPLTVFADHLGAPRRGPPPYGPQIKFGATDPGAGLWRVCAPPHPRPHLRHTHIPTTVIPAPHLRHTRARRGYLDVNSADVRATLGEIAAAERGNDGGAATFPRHSRPLFPRHSRACRGYLDEYSADVRATLGEIAAAERGNDGGGAGICPERPPSARARLIRRPKLDLGPIRRPLAARRTGVLCERRQRATPYPPRCERGWVWAPNQVWGDGRGRCGAWAPHSVRYPCSSQEPAPGPNRGQAPRQARV